MTGLSRTATLPAYYDVDETWRITTTQIDLFSSQIAIRRLKRQASNNYAKLSNIHRREMPSLKPVARLNGPLDAQAGAKAPEQPSGSPGSSVARTGPGCPRFLVV